MNKDSDGSPDPETARSPVLRRTRDGAMLYDASRAGNASAEWFQNEFWLAQGAAARTPAGRGAAFFIEHAGKSWVLRHYRRGGFVARLSHDRYFWMGAAHTRPFREWHLLSELHRSGLPVPAPVAARYRRSGLFYSGDLIVERIAGAQPLSERLAAAPLPLSVWESVGRCVRRFHDAGVRHADLNAHNILLDAAEHVFLIDFDRGRRCRPGRWRASNLARLQRSLQKVTRALPADRFCDADWKAFLRGYR